MCFINVLDCKVENIYWINWWSELVLLIKTQILIRKVKFLFGRVTLTLPWAHQLCAHGLGLFSTLAVKIKHIYIFYFWKQNWLSFPKKKIAHYVPCLWNFIYASVNKSSTITKKNTCPKSLTPACAWNHCDKPPSNTVSHHPYKNSLSETRVNVRFYQVFSCLHVHSQRAFACGLVVGILRCGSPVA